MDRPARIQQFTQSVEHHHNVRAMHTVFFHGWGTSPNLLQRVLHPKQYEPFIQTITFVGRLLVVKLTHEVLILDTGGWAGAHPPDSNAGEWPIGHPPDPTVVKIEKPLFSIALSKVF